MLYSFDVFDTLITRQVATPKGIFALMQKSLLERRNDISQYVKDNFYYLRIHAEELARENYQRYGIEDVTLEQIYEALGTIGAILPKELQVLCRMEESVELSNTVGIEKNIAEVRRLLQKKERVILISDMYLSEEIIRKMLVSVDNIFENIPLYVSSKYLANKYSGKLFDIVKKQEGADFNFWEHCGDNLVSDMKIPLSKGIKVKKPVVYIPLLPTEADMLNNNEHDVDLQLRIGYARQIRWQDGKQYTPLSMGASVAAPVLIPYVEWFLAESLRRGVKRLYFIARDGYILKTIADIIIKARGIAIRTHYIYGSRLAWRLPAYDGKQGSLILLAKWSHPRMMRTVRQLADVMGLSVEELSPYLEEKYHDADKDISHYTYSMLIRELDQNIEFRQMLREKQDSKRQLVLKYLRQEIDFSDNDLAFIDLGGGGYTQGCLASMVAMFSNVEVKTFFYKMDRINLMPNCVYYNFFPSHVENNLLIEMICRAPHGQTDGYVERDGMVVPVLKDNEGEKILACGYNEYVHGIEKYVGKYIEDNDQIPKIGIEYICRFLESVKCSFSSEMLAFFGGLPNTLTGREKNASEFAPELTKKEIRDIFLFGKEYSGTDYEFSLLRTGTIEKQRIDKYCQLREKIFERYERIWHKSITGKWEGRLPNKISDWLNKRVVLYGAGKFGRQIYDWFKHEGVDIVSWVDRNYKDLSRRGIPVTGDITSLKDVDYDFLMIAVVDKKIQDDIKKELYIMGEKKGTIICISNISEYINSIENFLEP